MSDLADPAAVDDLAAAALDELGGVDVLVNNAGIPKRRHVTRLDPATVESVMNINFFSPVRLTLALLPHMLERGSGRIVNISSVAATLSSPGESAYDASKAAVTAFSESMAVDLWQTGIKVLVVYPGLVDTELFSLPDNDPVVAASGGGAGERAGRRGVRRPRQRCRPGLRARLFRRSGLRKGRKRGGLPLGDGEIHRRPPGRRLIARPERSP